MLTIYKASAGSGKTFSLTRRYLITLLGVKSDDGTGKYRLNDHRYGPVLHNRHRPILAITFTNKATEEMKQRIIHELDAIASGRPCGARGRSKHIEALTELFGCTEDELVSTAARAMRELLHDFANFNISTIDSFFQQVMRNMAYELDYPGDYQVSLDQDSVAAEGIGLMFDDFNTSVDSGRLDSPIARSLRRLMTEKRNSGAVFNLFNRTNRAHLDMVASIRGMFDEDYQVIAPEFEAWLATPGAVENMERQLTARMDILAAALFEAAQRLHDGLEAEGFFAAELVNKTKLANPLSKIVGGRALPDVKSLSTAYARSYIGGEPIDAFLKKPGKKGPLLIPSENLGRLMADFEQAYAGMAEYYDLRAVLDSANDYRVIAIALQYIRRFRAENNLVLLSDTNELLHRIMQSDAQVPFVYEKMGVRLHNFLIDEFQDTSRLQWQNLRPLVDNGLADGSDSLIIGDVKQAIYRFRNSDSRLLRSDVPAQYPRALLRGHAVDDNTNRRSSPTVVRFNNSLFYSWAQAEGVPGYEGVGQHTAPDKAGLTGYVRIFDLSARDDAGSEDAAAEADAPQALEDLMLGEILRQHRAGYRWRDIAVLVNTNTQATGIGAYLLGKGIPVSTQEALLIRNSRAVSTIVSVLGLLVRASRKTIVHGRQAADVQGMTALFDYLLATGTDSGKSPQEAAVDALHAAFGSKDRTPALPASLDDITGDNPSSLTSLVESVILHRLSDAERVDEIAYITAFQDVVVDYSATYGNNLTGFLRYWSQNERKLSIQTPEDADAINVMTIHKSKGLEYNCVHIPYANYTLEGNRSKTEYKWIAATAADRALGMPPYVRIAMKSDLVVPGGRFGAYKTANDIDRLTDGFNKTYVAFTRAKRELMLYYEPKSAGKGHYDRLHDILESPLPKAPVTDPVSGVTVDASDSDVFIELPQGLVDDGYVLGSPTAPEAGVSKDESDVAESEVLDAYNVTTGGEAGAIINVEALVGGEDDPVADEDDVATALTPAMLAAADRGTRIHNALCRIHLRHEVEPVLQRMMRRGALDIGEADEVRRIFSAEATAGYIDRWFGAGVIAHNEMTVYTPGDTARPVGRIDRIVFGDDGTVDIIDYKTTAVAGHALQSEERGQLGRYMQAVAAMFPDRRVRGYVVRTAVPAVLEVL